MAEDHVSRQLPALPADYATKEASILTEIDQLRVNLISLRSDVVLSCDDVVVSTLNDEETREYPSASDPQTAIPTSPPLAPQKNKRRSSLLCGLSPSKDDDDVSSKRDSSSSFLPFCQYTDWMGSLPQHLHEFPLNQLAIPGSHDSCTSTLDRDGGLHPDAPEVYRDVLKVLGTWAKTVAHRWSQTQDKTFAQQLELGVRYFDLRISVRPGSENLFLVHGFYACKVQDCLISISSWLNAHPKEIVLLDMNHFHGLEDKHHIHLIDIIYETFGNKLCPFLTDIKKLTLSFMWHHRRQVVIFYHRVKSGVSSPHAFQTSREFLWPGEIIPSPWPRTTKIKDLVDFLEHNYIHCSRSHCFYVNQGVLTPTVYTVIGHVTSSLKDHFATNAAPAVVEWLKYKSIGPQGINIVILDFVDLDPSYIETVVGLNYGRSGLHPGSPNEAPVCWTSAKSPEGLTPSSQDAWHVTSALTSRALTPTPLAFIDAGNSPSVTPQRGSAEGDGVRKELGS